jgi:hypothetical protein
MTHFSIKAARHLAWMLGTLLACCAYAQPPAQSANQPAKPIHQLRIYEIFEGNKQAFHERFRDHAMRIMAKYDFKIVAMWESRHEGRTELIYILEWPDEATLKDRWTKFMADQEWSDIKKRTAAVHGKLVGGIQDRVLELTDYSPATTLLEST